MKSTILCNLLIIILSVSCIDLYAQSDKPKRNKLQDSKKLKHLLNKYHLELGKRDTIKALDYFDKALPLVIKSSSPNTSIKMLLEAYYINKSKSDIIIVDTTETFYFQKSFRSTNYVFEIFNIAAENPIDEKLYAELNYKFYGLKNDTIILERWINKESHLSPRKKAHIIYEFTSLESHLAFHFGYENKDEYLNKTENFIAKLNAIGISEDGSLISAFINSLIAQYYAELYFSTLEDEYRLMSDYYIELTTNNNNKLNSNRFDFVPDSDEIKDKYSTLIKKGKKKGHQTIADSLQIQLCIEKQISKAIGLVYFHENPKMSVLYLRLSNKKFVQHRNAIKSYNILLTYEFQWYINLIEILNWKTKRGNGKYHALTGELLYKCRYSKHKIEYTYDQPDLQEMIKDNIIFLPGYENPVLLLYYNYRTLFDGGIKEFKDKIILMLNGALKLAIEYEGDIFFFMNMKGEEEELIRFEKKVTKSKEYNSWMYRNYQLLNFLKIDKSSMTVGEYRSLTKCMELETKLVSKIDYIPSKKEWSKHYEEVVELYNSLLNAVFIHREKYKTTSVEIANMFSGSYQWKLPKHSNLLRHFYFYWKNGDLKRTMRCNEKMSKYIVEQISKKITSGILEDDISTLTEIAFDLSSPVVGEAGLTPYDGFFCDSDTNIINLLYDFGQGIKKNKQFTSYESTSDFLVSIDLAKSSMHFRNNEFEKAYETGMPRLYYNSDVFKLDKCYFYNSLIKVCYKTNRYDEITKIANLARNPCVSNGLITNPINNAIISESLIKTQNFGPAKNIIENDFFNIEIDNASNNSLKHKYRGHLPGTKIYFYYLYDSQFRLTEIVKEFERISDFLEKHRKGNIDRGYYSFDQSVIFYNYYSIILRINGNKLEADSTLNRRGLDLRYDYLIKPWRFENRDYIQYKNRAIHSWNVANLYKAIYDQEEWTDEQVKWFSQNKEEATIELNLLIKRLYKFKEYDIYLHNSPKIIQAFKDISDSLGELNAHYLWFTAMSSVKGIEHMSPSESLRVLDRMKELVNIIEKDEGSEYSHHQIIVLESLIKRQIKNKERIKLEKIKVEFQKKQIARDNIELTEVRDSLKCAVSEAECYQGEAENQTGIAEYNAEKEARRADENFYLWIASIILFVIILSIIFYYQIKARKQNRELKKISETLMEKTVSLEKQSLELTIKNKKIEKHQNEMTHRVVNNLKSIRGIVSSRIRNTDGHIKNELEKIKGHLNLALEIQGVIKKTMDYHGKYNPSFIEGLTRKISKLNEVNCYTNIDKDISLNYEDAYALGVIINEAITNSTKHAFTKTKSPEVFVRLFKENKQRIVLEVGDNGCGLTDVETFRTNSYGHSMGMTLIRQNGEDLNSEDGVSIINSQKGLMYRVSFETEKAA